MIYDRVTGNCVILEGSILIFPYVIVSAKHSWHLHDYTRSKRHAKYATTFAVLGIIVGVTTYAVALSLYFTLRVDTSCPVTTTSGNTNFENQPNTTVITTIGRIVPTITANTTHCCSYCPPLGKGRNSFRVVGPTEPACSVFCTTTGNGPIYPDPNGKYNDCCNELRCQFVPS